jgi:hypothetical protein
MEEIVAHLNSYTEASPSGTGIHIIIRGALPPGRRLQGLVEMYDTARFFTMTGDHIISTPVVVEERSFETRGCVDAALFGKPAEELLVLLAGVAPHDGPQPRVGFQRRRVRTHWNRAWCVSTSIKRLLRDMVEWSGTLSSSAMRTNDRIDRLSLARHAIPRSGSIPSKYPT